MALASTLATLALLAGCSASPEATPDKTVDPTSPPATVRITTTSSVSNLAVWVAEEQGYFAKHNLDAQIETITTPILAQVPSLLGKQFDIGYGLGPNLLAAASEGLDVVAIAGSVTFSSKDDSTMVIATKASGITKPADLVGKRLAAPSVTGNINVATMYWLSKQGIDPKSVEVVAASTPNMPDLLAAGQLDAAEVTMPYSGVMLASGDYVKVGSPLPAVGDPVHMSFWISERKWAEENGTVIKNFRAALDDAETWISANKEAALDLVMKKTDQPAEFKAHTVLPVFTTKITAAQLEEWRKAMNVVSGFTTDVKMESLIFEPK